MPRPRNTILQAVVDRNEFNQVVCNNGNCRGKILNPHTGNVERHLRLLHPDIYSSYMEKKMAMQKKSSTITTTATTTTTTRVVKPKVLKCEPKKTNIELAIVEFFTKSEQPLCILEDRAFKIIAQPVFQSLGISVNRQSVLELINGCSQKLKTEIIDELTGHLVSLKIDIATKQDITLLGINVQYIKERSIHVKSLAIKELQFSYSSDYVKSVITEVLNEYTIDIHQILSISTSNDGLIIDGVNELNEELRSSLCGETAVSNKSIKKESNFTNSFEEWLEFSEPDFSTYKIASVLSGAHILQLCMEEFFQKSEVKVKLEKCKLTLKELRNQTSLHIYANERTTTNDCAQYWTVTYEMLERLYELRDMVVPLSSTNNGLYLNSDEWSFVKEFVEACKTVYTATTRFQREQLCYSELFIIIMEILFELEKLPANNIAKSLFDVFNCQKTKLLDTELFLAAVFLDPRIRVCLDAAQKTRAKEYITALYNRISSSKGESANSETNESLLVEMTTDEQPTNSSNSVTPKSFCEFLQNIDADTLSPQYSYLETDITLYERQPRLPLSSNIIDFWYYQHNCLTDIANIILAIPCTEVSAGCLLSALQYILTDKPNRLTAANIDHILRVKVNGIFTYEE